MVRKEGIQAKRARVSSRPYAATVVRPGRTFVRRIIELLSVARSRDQWVRLNASTCSDLTWWEVFLEGWNGVSMMPRFSMPVITVESDASGCWGCGARWGSQWLQWQWPEAAQRWQIAPKELLPILFAVAILGTSLEWAPSELPL